MHQRLKLHPDYVCPAVEAVEVEIARLNGGRLQLHYRLTGSIEALAVPRPAEPKRQDGLWQHLCFEVFVRPLEGQGYFELNFGTSRAWAAYRFDTYRSGMRDVELLAPAIEVRTSTDLLELSANVALPVEEGPWQVGLSAVVEDREGGISYWALEHPPGKADFHDPHCFALELPPAPQP